MEKRPLQGVRMDPIRARIAGGAPHFGKTLRLVGMANVALGRGKRVRIVTREGEFTFEPGTTITMEDIYPSQARSNEET